ncbi:uncharacterized protein BJ212DRAFT_1483459 [Suillus subaureus]|uniref:Uncharacterized protein n=1 Tax=Suillus subaureus TaxID=48587 RepID=A0A9P7E5Y8_9AGAM|nr:uncharacterized protein BJ212DRAFT_1483459 [Suillus subaureus]KAG1811726.1 hypothetical protein BJ212DRAFT_1483459 [Suillus subaureus]
MLEGGIAAKVQLGHEIIQIKSLTFSSDSTMHRDINMNSWHVSYKALTYSCLNKSTPEQHNWFLGIKSSKDHTSETQLQGLKTTIDKMASIYNDSPLAQRIITSELTTVIFTSKLKGINGDHSADQKKVFELIQRWKNNNWRDELGMQADGLPNDKLRAAEFLVWVGCCMHKDLNLVKGRNVAMMDSWEVNGFECPMLLANKDNATTLQQPSEMVTEVQLRALEVSGQGGIKTCSLASAIFNNKDDKKG